MGLDITLTAKLVDGSTPELYKSISRPSTVQHDKPISQYRIVYNSMNGLHGFPGLFTVISEHICFLLLVFMFLHFFSCRFRAVD